MTYTLPTDVAGARPLSIGAANAVLASGIEIFGGPTLTGGIDSVGRLDNNFSSVTVTALGVLIIPSPDRLSDLNLAEPARIFKKTMTKRFCNPGNPGRTATKPAGRGACHEWKGHLVIQ